MIGSWLLPIPFFISFKLKFLGVKVVTYFFGALMVVESSMFGLFIINLAANPCIARDNYFYCDFIKKKFTI